MEFDLTPIHLPAKETHYYSTSGIIIIIIVLPRVYTLALLVLQ